MVSIIGAVMTGIACAYFGFRMSMSLKMRRRSLADIITSLEMLETEIDFSVNRLNKALKAADRTGLFTLTAEKINEETAGEALKSAVNEMQGKLCLTDADCAAVKMLAANLGRTDAASQLKSIKYVKSLVSELYKNADEDYKRLGKLYSGGGILIGLFIVVILI